MIEDLSRRHDLVSDLFRSPDRPPSGTAIASATSRCAFFHEHGYLTGIRILDDEQVEAAHGVARAVRPEASGQRAVLRIPLERIARSVARAVSCAGSLAHHAGLSRYALWHPAFTMPASQLLGGAVRFWHDQLFCKPAQHGGVVAWHQDYSYWTRTEPMAHLTCWIGLDDATRDNGCLHYVPGSHRWQLLPVTGLAGDMDAIQSGARRRSRGRNFRARSTIELKKGEAAFHHPLMVHGSYENRTDRPRRATVINVFRDGIISNTNTPLLKGVPVVGKGQKVEGPFFPLLFGPTRI